MGILREIFGVRSMGLLAAVTGLAAIAGGQPSAAQDVYPEPDKCPRLVAEVPYKTPSPYLLKASFRIEPVQAPGEGHVAITYVGHSTFLIESPAGVRIATDYNDSHRPDETPTVATMNRAHITHYSVNPEPGIEHLLKGWGEGGVPAAHDLTVRDVWLRNITTNIRGGFDDMGGVQRDQNSMFIFEVSGLCILHLGHLHHKLTEDHLKAVGRVDVVMAPVDGSRTLSTASLMEVLQDLQAPVVIPMHFFGSFTLTNFVNELEERYAVETLSDPTLVLSRDTLPPIPTLYVMSPF